MRALMQGSVLILSGPSGSGKSSIVRSLKSDPRVVFSISATTRKPRAGEVDGVDYHFLSKDEFREHIERGAFIEHAEVHGNLYGTLREPMDAAVRAGRVYLVEIDVQGAMQLKELGVDAEYVFVAPPSMDALRKRLESRGTDAPDVIERRLKKAHDEMEERHRYTHLVVNSDLDAAVAEVRRLVGLDGSDGPEGPEGPEKVG
jgi:guanylate kinase